MAQSTYREKPQEVHANNLHILKDRIKNAELSGAYLFYGDEEYTKNHYCSLLTKSAGSNLNVSTFYKSEFNLPDFLSACETSAVESLDMFSSLDEDEKGGDDKDSSYRVIKLYSPDFSSLSKSDCEYFLDFLQNLPEKTIVIFWFYATEESVILKGTYKKLCDIALTVNFKREKNSSNILITWILRHFSKEKLNVERHVAVHLCQTVGNSMTDLKNEIDKLIEYLRFENRDTLEVADIDFICIKSTEAQIFDISNGALSGNFQKAVRALNVLRDKREKPILILGTLSKAVNDLCITDSYTKKGLTVQAISKKCALAEFAVKNYASVLSSRNRDFKGEESFCSVCSNLCMEYDKKMKSSRTDGYELLLELIFKLSFAGKVG